MRRLTWLCSGLIAACLPQAEPDAESATREPDAAAPPAFDAGSAQLGADGSSPEDARDGFTGMADAAGANAGGADAAPPPKPAGELDAGIGSGSPPFAADGQPLAGSAGSWTYTEFPDTQCREGTPAGVAVNLGSSTEKLMIFLEAGGRCSNADECFLNLGSADLLVLGLGTLTAAAGVFDRSHPENPVRDWSFVYVPYCTGDFFAGANPDANVPEVGPQRLVGHLNMQKFLKRIVPTFRDASDVLLTGTSAGGFGTAFNASLVQRAFPGLKVRFILDSSPLLSKAAFAECLQERYSTLWRADQTFLADCGAACPNQKDYAVDFGLFFARTFADRPVGLIEAMEDSVERILFGASLDNCTRGIDLLDPGIPAAAFRQELLGFREKIQPFANFATFFPESEGHTWIAADEFYTINAGGVRLVDWFEKIANGANPGHAGP